MTPIAPLVPEGEAAWLRVKQHLQWCDSFALVFVFSDQPAVADCLRERLADVYRARITRLEVPMPRSPRPCSKTCCHGCSTRPPTNSP